MGLTLENIGQWDSRSAHIAVFGSLLVELPQVYRAATNRHDLIEVDIGLDRKSTRLNSSHANESRMPSSA